MAVRRSLPRSPVPACISGPYGEIEIHGASVDWEVELVVVIGRRADRVAEADAWSHVAGLTVGQDISDANSSSRRAATSHWASPVGGTVHWPLARHARRIRRCRRLALGCAVDGVTMQDSRTADLVFGVRRWSPSCRQSCRCCPENLIFTGTPGGVGFRREPPVTLQPGNELTSWIEGIGTMRNRCVAP